MRGDFSRMSFDSLKHFTRVLEQQGRVQLDADENERGEIFLHLLRTVVADLIGPHGGPGPDDFKITVVAGADRVTDLGIGFGRYYVEGVMVENEALDECGRTRDPVTYFSQPHYFLDPTSNPDHRLPATFPFLAYLDVWERHVTALEDETIREVALLGPDTSTRAQVVWQVKTALLNADQVECLDDEAWGTLVEGWQPKNRGCMKADANPGDPSTEACILPPESRFRGFENQLYRVEIHRGGAEGEATFKWSRNNGSIIFPVDGKVTGLVITLKHLGRDGGYSLQKGDWVEIVDDHYELDGRTESLLKVAAVDRTTRQVTLEGTLPPNIGGQAELHPLLRRWDQKSTGPTQVDSSGTLPLVEGKWLDLENQVQVYFEDGGMYRTGDYWLIPARVATGDVIWPLERGLEGNMGPALRPPHGVHHYYAPLAIITALAGDPVSCRREFDAHRP